MQYLAIDPGSKRTGLAVGSSVLRMATPLQVVHATTPALRMDAIAKAIKEQGPDALVLGLPLNMDGSEGQAAKAAHAFAKELEEKFGLPVHLVDERLTSEQANAHMSQSGLTHGQKKQRRDALAASVILQDYLDSLPQ